MEFALVIPLLVALLMGIFDYGFLFSNSVASRQGVREGARQAVVCGWPDPDPSTTCDANQLSKVAEIVKNRTNLISGSMAVRVQTVSALGAPTSNWIRGGSVLVCAVTHTDATGLTPFPAGGYTRTKVLMRIERPMPPLGSEPTTVSQPAYTTEADPSGQNWGFCHA